MLSQILLETTTTNLKSHDFLNRPDRAGRLGAMKTASQVGVTRPSRLRVNGASRPVFLEFFSGDEMSAEPTFETATIRLRERRCSSHPFQGLDVKMYKC